jgi:ParB family chromosome partitioning protein
MTNDKIESIPVEQIRIANPRTRNKIKWLAIVASIKAVGLKKPITVSRRASPDGDGKLYDLVCGQGRLEAFFALEEATIPAVISNASAPDQYLMSLVENIARRPSSNRTIYFEVRSLLERGNDGPAIAKKLGIDRSYIHGIVRLVEKGETKLIEAVEAGRLPLSVAVEIASGSDGDVQKALIEGYEAGELRGSKLQAVRKLIKDRNARREGTPVPAAKPLTGAALANLYKQRVRDQQRLVFKADQAKEKLLIIATIMRSLLADEDLITVLRAEKLYDMPEQLAIRVR